MKKYFEIVSFLGLIFVFFFSLYSEINIHQLEQNISHFQGKEKIEVLLFLATEYWYSIPSQSLIYGKQALELSIAQKDTANIYSSLENIATSHGILDQKEDAIVYYLKALELNSSLCNSTNEVSLLSNIAYLYDSDKNWDKALDYYEKLMKFYIRENSQQKVAEILTKMAAAYKEKQDYDLALQYYIKSLEIDEENIKELLKDDYIKFDDVYDLIEQDELALSYYRQYLTHQDSLSQMEQQKLIEEQEKTENNQKQLTKQFEQQKSELTSLLHEAEHQSKTKEKKLEKIKAEKEIQEITLKNKELELENVNLQLQHTTLTIEQQKNQRRYFFIILLVAISFAIIHVYLYHQKRIDNLRLEKANNVVQKKNDELLNLNKKLEEIARTDPLTNLANRRALLEYLEYERIRFERGHHHFIIIICDIDNFKNVNDSYGHDFGDYVLKTISSIMQETLRKQDVVGRWGGEEFLIMLPETSLQGGIIAANKVRKNIAQHDFSLNDISVKVTMTFGLEIYNNSEDLIKTINRADKALYNGKNSGKNKVVAYSKVLK